MIPDNGKRGHIDQVNTNNTLNHNNTHFLQDVEELHDHNDEIALEYAISHPNSHYPLSPDLETQLSKTSIHIHDQTHHSHQHNTLEPSQREKPAADVHTASSCSANSSETDSDTPTNKLHDPTYFPDGGWQAWRCLLGGFLAVFTTWGVITSFGPFSAYYRHTLLSSSSSFQIGWISSLQLSCVFMGGVFTGRPFDSGYFYHLLITGSVIIVVMFFLLAECTKYYQVLLAQGVGMGLGMGMLFGPCLACTGSYFKKYRGIAMCVCSAGGGVGGVIFPIVANNLLREIGFSWTIRVLGFIELALLSLMILVMRDRLPFAVRQKYAAQKNNTSVFAIASWVDSTALKSPEFMFFVVGVTCCFFGLYIPFAQIQTFALHIHTDPNVATYIVSILNTASTVGRLSVFLIANNFGALNMTIIFSLCSAATCYAWFTIKSNASMILFAIFYGYLAGVVGTFPPFCIPHLTEDITKLGTRFGMCFLSLSLMLSFSIPIAGLCLGPDGTNYKASAILSGTVFAAGCVFMCLGRIGKAGFKMVVI